MKLNLLLILLFGIFTCFSCLPKKQIPKWTEASDFIFLGTVIVVQSSTVEVEDASMLAVVRVDKIIDGSPVFSDLTGKEVTVQAKNIGQLKKGGQWTFFTKSWLFGEELAVIEIGHTPGVAVESMVKTARANHSDAELAARLASSEMVVLATVASTKIVDKNQGDMLSEHDPDWILATLEVTEVLKGNPATKTTAFHFASSKDMMWFAAPKFQKGQSGIFLLKKPGADITTMPGSTGIQYVLVDPANFLKSEDLQRVKRLNRK